MKMILRAAVVMSVVLAASASHAQAQTGAANYPNRPVKVVLPFPPGGVADVAGRLIAQKLSENLGQSFVIENRGGAAGNIGASLVQDSAPDGYTVMITSSSPSLFWPLHVISTPSPPSSCTVITPKCPGPGYVPSL